MRQKDDAWPELPLNAWQDTYDTLHMWTQIVGKIRLTQTPLVNHYWNATLYVNARGLTTSAIPYADGIFEIEFDFIAHKLLIRTSQGDVRTLDLAPWTVADFYMELISTLAALEIDVQIHAKPDEVANPIPFADDRTHKSYDREYVDRFRRLLISVDQVMKNFRARFIGKCSPVHFFWGSFDLAVTRFSGRLAPPRPDPMMQEAYSHEVSSVGFWPGGGDIKGPAFYSYTAPEPAGFKTYAVRPASAFYHHGIGEFLLMYDDIREAASPESELMEFFESTYEAGANLAKWDRDALERAQKNRATTGD
ncbi:MAG: hypothetical protein JOZ32_17775 [Bryobacterales bacterium]|nr:hypothetical protein [Bryobacterales bacterium]